MKLIHPRLLNAKAQDKRYRLRDRRSMMRENCASIARGSGQAGGNWRPS
jgi:hypothetical protein